MVHLVRGLGCFWVGCFWGGCDFNVVVGVLFCWFVLIDVLVDCRLFGYVVLWVCVVYLSYYGRYYLVVCV